MDQLVLRTQPFDDGDWRIWLEMRGETFSGRGWCWARAEELETFAADLSHFPLSNGATLSLGYGALEGDDLRLVIDIHPIGVTGGLEARVEIADDEDPTCRLKAKICTSYASVDRFVPQLRALVLRARDEAILSGD